VTEHLNSAQLQQIQKEAERQIGAYIDRLQLRKWAIEQTLTMCSEPHVTFPNGRALIDMAQAIYDFVAKPDPDKPL
jgi:hypothetical protein